MKRHEPNITSFVFGLIFVGLALVWPFVELDILDYSGLGIILPAVLIGCGRRRTGDVGPQVTPAGGCRRPTRWRSPSSSTSSAWTLPRTSRPTDSDARPP